MKIDWHTQERHAANARTIRENAKKILATREHLDLNKIATLGAKDKSRKIVDVIAVSKAEFFKELGRPPWFPQVFFNEIALELLRDLDNGDWVKWQIPK